MAGKKALIVRPLRPSQSFSADPRWQNLIFLWISWLEMKKIFMYIFNLFIGGKCIYFSDQRVFGKKVLIFLGVFLDFRSLPLCTTLVCLINVLHGLFNFGPTFTLHDLIWPCTFINFWTFFQTAWTEILSFFFNLNENYSFQKSNMFKFLIRIGISSEFITS